MDKATVQLLIDSSQINCVLYKEMFRLRFTLRNHLKREHTEIEAETFINNKI